MRICKQDNYLLGSSRVIPYGLVVVLGGLFVTVCGILWYAALDSQGNQTGPMLHLVALAATLLTAFGIPKLVENCRFSKLRWHIRDTQVILENEKDKYAFDLSQPYLVTRYTFWLDKLGPAPMFCLMRPDTPYRFRNSSGFGAMKQFLNSGGILLPRQALSALLYTTGLEHIPNYPQTVRCQGQ